MFTTLVLLSTLALTISPPPAADVALQLERRTQELLDAIAAGNREPWVRYLHDDLIYAAEDGSIKSKAQLLEELQPLPKQIWGKLRVAHFRMVRSGATAVCGYVTDEDEGYYGQVIHARGITVPTPGSRRPANGISSRRRCWRCATIRLTSRCRPCSTACGKRIESFRISRHDTPVLKMYSLR